MKPIHAALLMLAVPVFTVAQPIKAKPPTQPGQRPRLNHARLVSMLVDLRSDLLLQRRLLQTRGKASKAALAQNRQMLERTEQRLSDAKHQEAKHEGH